MKTEAYSLEAYNSVSVLEFFLRTNEDLIPNMEFNDTRDCSGSVMKTLYRDVNEAPQRAISFTKYNLTKIGFQMPKVPSE